LDLFCGILIYQQILGTYPQDFGYFKKHFLAVPLPVLHLAIDQFVPFTQLLRKQDLSSFRTRNITKGFKEIL